jgi:hypothetical protein
VDLLVENTTSEPRAFHGPDIDFKIISEEGWSGRYDIFASAEIRAAEDQWVGSFSPGIEYPYSVVFSVSEHDPNLYQNGLSGWVMTIVEDGTHEYVLEVGDLPEP